MRIKSAKDLAIPDGSRSISLVWGTFVIDFKCGARRETHGMESKLWND